MRLIYTVVFCGLFFLAHQGQTTGIIQYNKPGRNFLPKEIHNGHSFDIHFTSYTHLRYTIIQADANTRGEKNYWSLRRLKLLTNGQWGGSLEFAVQVIYKTHNHSSSDDQIYLQHAFLKFRLSDFFILKIGQFKPPFGWERFQPDFRMPCVERSQAINRLIPNGSLDAAFVRDYGVQLSGQLAKSSLRCELAAMSGSGANTPLTNKNAPLVISRFSLKKTCSMPWTTQPCHLLLQLAYSKRWDGNINFMKQLPGAKKEIFQHFQGTDNRWDVAFALNLAETYFAVECLYASFLPTADTSTKLCANGWFVQFSHLLNPNWESVIKYETFDPNRGIVSGHDLCWLTLGVNYYFNRKGGRLMLDYIHKSERRNAVRNDMLVVQLQYFLFGAHSNLRPS